MNYGAGGQKNGRGVDFIRLRTITLFKYPAGVRGREVPAYGRTSARLGALDL